MLIDDHVADAHKRTVCIREVQRSLDQSVKTLIEKKIEALGVGSHFDVQKTTILSTKGTGRISFVGMQDHTAESVKSLEGYDCAWVEEAQSLSDLSLRLLRPTIRKPGSELWFTWNPRHPDDAVDALLRGKSVPPGAVVVEVNADDNPWFPDVLKAERELDRVNEPQRFDHIWRGAYDTGGEGRVYYRFDRNVHCAAPVVPKGTGALQLACDFNVGEMHWLLCETHRESGRVHVLKEIIGHNTSTDEQAEVAAKVIADELTSRKRYDVTTREHVRAMRLEAFCDASGANRTAVTALTHVSLLTQAGFRARHGGANPLITDRINTVQVLLRDRRLSIDPSCVRLIRALEQQAYVDGKPDKSNNIDHGVDALGYLCHWQMGVKASKSPAPTVAHARADEWGAL